ncbi:MAG: CtsR family transcriptional regulator [Clostridiales bacterium]|nr:CtsR family transcriptional regulator [Clostridiales bacterium]
MARLSDIIEGFIKEMLENSQQNVLEIQRNELANLFNCAPSQINYVLTTRFTVDKGYYIESRRGGGGFIKITRVDIDKNEYIKEAIRNNIKDNLTQKEAEEYIELFMERGFLSEREAMIIRAAVNDRTIPLDGETKNKIRAYLLKNMLLTIIE